MNTEFRKIINDCISGGNTYKDVDEWGRNHKGIIVDNEDVVSILKDIPDGFDTRTLDTLYIIFSTAEITITPDIIKSIMTFILNFPIDEVNKGDLIWFMANSISSFTNDNSFKNLADEIIYI